MQNKASIENALTMELQDPTLIKSQKITANLIKLDKRLR